MKNYKIKITFANNKRKIKFVTAEDELEAMDKVVEHYKNSKIVDMIVEEELI